MLRRFLGLTSFVFFSACSSTEDPPPPPASDAAIVESDAGVEETDAGVFVTYYKDIKVILDAKCVGCHEPGAIGRLDFTNPMLVQQQAPLILTQVQLGKMPPWPPSNECQSYLHDRSLSEAQKQTITEWASTGAHEGDPSTEPPALPRDIGGLSRVDETLRISDMYTPREGDDYRCFVIDWPSAETRYVSGFNIVPTEPRIVHHVNIFSIDPANADRIRTRDQNSAGPGYPCFGGAATEAGAGLLGAWAPGSIGLEYPLGTGLAVEPGSVVILEAHYMTPPESGLSDQMALDVRLETDVEKQAIIIAFWDFIEWSRNGNMLVPANDPDVVHSVEVDPNGAINIVAPWLRNPRLLIHGTGLHMHYLGTRGKLTIRRSPELGEECLIEIRDWDFNWQAGYMLEEPMEFVVGRDRAFLECHFDNTAGNQPLINGTPRTPADANWGGASTDEMCIGYAYITEQ